MAKFSFLKDVFKKQRRKPVWQSVLLEDSPLRKLDPRVKMLMALSASLMVMLPLNKLIIFLCVYVIIILWARLLSSTLRQLWRLKWILTLLFLLDWWMVDIQLAVMVSLRLILLTSTFSFLFSTTTFGEFRLAMEGLGVPYRLAFSLALAFQSLSLFEEEWLAIQEAQQARGITVGGRGLKGIVYGLRDWLALTIPTIVLSTRRAWAITEAAYSRGFDSPRRKPFNKLSMKRNDWLIIVVCLILPVLFFWRYS